jgi:hypothetical protein
MRARALDIATTNHHGYAAGGVRENNATTIRKTRASGESAEFLEVAAHKRSVR